MKRVKFSEKELVDLIEMQSVGDLADASLKEAVKRFLYSGFTLFNGLNVTQTPAASGSVLVVAGLGLDSGAVLNVESAQTVHIISGTGGWGTPQAANATQPRYSIVCLKYAPRDTDTAAKWFLDDSNPEAPTEYEATLATRIADYYSITVVHGTAAASPTVPATPEGYTKIAEILVPAGATTVTTPNIVSKLPVASRTLEQLLDDFRKHNHDNSYYTETESNTLFAKKGFANVKVGGTTIAAGNKEDTVELVPGDNVTLTADATTKKVTIKSSFNSDHGSLTGLGDDDHEQYLTATRHTAIKGNPHDTKHSDLDLIGQVDPTSTDATRDKHVSNADMKGVITHAAAKGNPHETKHADLGEIGQVDPTSQDATRDKHLSNKDLYDLINTGNTKSHIFVGPAAPNPAQYLAWYDLNINRLRSWNGMIWQTQGTYQ